MGLLTSAESGLRREADELAEGYLRSPGNVGLVVGLLVRDECLCLGYGKVAEDSARPPDAGTVFEIGSITKVFTAALLAEMAGREEVRLDQPVAELLPREVRVPSYRGRAITLAHLAEHTAALPRLPGNLWATATDQKNPYRDYRVAHLYESLGGAAIGFPPGTGAAYSNLGAGLLGHVLALRAGRPFEDLLAERVLRPLGLADTGITLSADQAARLAPGHTGKGEPTPNWDIPSLAGAGALRSTAAEMLTFLRANLDPPGTPAGAALRACHAPRPVAWWRRVGVGALHGSRTGGRVAADPAGRPGAGRELEVPGRVLPAGAGRPRVEGLLGGGVDGGRGVGWQPAAGELVVGVGAGLRERAHLPRSHRACRRLPPPARPGTAGVAGGRGRSRWDGPVAQRGDRRDTAASSGSWPRRR